jgi:cellulose biosynthesis protein BcsQ
MAVIGVYSAKGGVGKTTMAVDIAWRSAVLSKHRTLIWDLDPQGGAGFLLGCEARQSPRAASVFQRDGRPHELIEATRYDRLSLFQSDDSMRFASIAFARIGHKRRLAQLTDTLLRDYDRIVLDCPPTINEVSEQILHAADVLIVPLPASPLALRTLDSVRQELAKHNVRQPPILPILSMYSATREHHRDVKSGIAAGWPIVPLASQIEMAAVNRAPVGSFAAGSRPDKALHRVWEGIERRLAAMRPGGDAPQSAAA